MPTHHQRDEVINNVGRNEINDSENSQSVSNYSDRNAESSENID